VQRVFVRIRDGKFCFEKVTAGIYRLALGSTMRPNVPDWPLRAGFVAWDGTLENYRLRIGPKGEVAVLDGAGREVTKKAVLDLRVKPSEPGPQTVRLSAALHLPDPRDRDPVYFLVRTWDPATGILSSFFHWAEVSGGAATFELHVRPGDLQEFTIWSGRWGVAALRPGLGNLAWLESGAGYDLDVRMAPKAKVWGRVLLPDARPFWPRLADRAVETRLFGIEVFNDLDDLGRLALADADGVFEISDIVPGIYVLTPGGWGEGFDFAVGPPRMTLVPAGREQQVDFTLTEWGGLRVDTSPLRLPAPAPAPVAGWEFLVVGFPAGKIQRGLSLPELVTAPLQMQFGRQGGWQAMGATLAPGTVPTARLEPGTYDLFLIRHRDDGVVNRAVSVVATLRRIQVRPRQVDTAVFQGAGDMGGAAVLTCSLEGKRLLAAQALSRARTAEEIYTLVMPHLDVVDRSGRLAASVYASLAEADRRAAYDAMARSDFQGLERLLGGRRWEFRMEGLKAGRYVVRVPPGAYPEREREVELREGKTTALDIDLDAP